MNLVRIMLAAAGATIVDFVYGFAIYGSALASSFAAQPGVYRSAEAQMQNMPVGALGILLAMTAAAIMFAQGARRGVAAGARFGVTLGLFVVGAFVAVNYATINMGAGHGVRMAVAAAAEWLVAGAVIGAVYRDERR